MPSAVDSALLFAAVLINQVGRVMVPSVATSVLADPHFAFDADARKDYLAGVSVVCLAGKFVGGLVTDTLGGWCILSAVFALFLASSALIVTTDSVALFGASWWLNSLAYTVTWGAACQIIGSVYPEKERPAQLTRIASASRFGASLGSIFFGQLLSHGLHWRRALMPVLGAQALVAALCAFKWLGTPLSAGSVAAAATKPNGRAGTRAATAAVEAAPPPAAASTSAWGHVLTLNFWLMFAPKIVIFTYTQFFMNFLGPMLHANHGFSHGSATQTAGLCSFGSVIGLLVVGDRIYKGLGLRAQAGLVAVMLLICLAVPSVLISGVAVPPSAVAPLLFAWGVSYALPFYLPPGEFALRIGGKSAAALFTNLFDAGGFTMSFFWNRWATRVSKDGDYQPVLASLALFALLSLVSMPMCMVRAGGGDSPQHQRKAKAA